MHSVTYGLPHLYRELLVWHERLFVLVASPPFLQVRWHEDRT